PDRGQAAYRVVLRARSLRAQRLRRAARRRHHRQPKAGHGRHGLGQHGRAGQVHARPIPSQAARQGPTGKNRALEQGQADSAMAVAPSMLEAGAGLGRRYAFTMPPSRRWGLAFALAMLCWLAACSKAPVNSPYVRGAEAENVLYTA